jgi:hypothetical protein
MERIPGDEIGPRSDHLMSMLDRTVSTCLTSAFLVGEPQMQGGRSEFLERLTTSWLDEFARFCDNQNSFLLWFAKLRDEIAQIREAERLYLQGGKNKLDAVGDHARRLQRLQENLEQLNALTDWRKL